MKIGTVAGTNDSTTTIATNDMVQEHVTNFTKELFGYIANGIGDDISSIARTMLGEVSNMLLHHIICCDSRYTVVSTCHSSKFHLLPHIIHRKEYIVII